MGQKALIRLLVIFAVVGVVALIFKLTGFDDMLRSVAVVGWMTLIFGIVLYWADQTGRTEKTAESWGIKDAITMGLAQVLALIPGTSRSGITITAARTLGYNRSDAARLSMLMSIPTIVASAALLSLDVIGTPNVMGDIAIVAAMSFVAALCALVLMMKLLQSVSYTPYVIYRVIFGCFLLWLAYA